MTMINLEKCLSELKPGKGEFQIDDSIVKYNITPNVYQISITRSNDTSDALPVWKLQLRNMASKFIQDVQNLDDDVVKEVNELFDENSPISLNQFSKLLAEEENIELINKSINLYKKLVNQVVHKKILHLKTQIMYLSK